MTQTGDLLIISKRSIIQAYLGNIAGWVQTSWIKGTGNERRHNFLNLFIYFNWRLIILQYCGSFCHTLTWISHGCTCVPHPIPQDHSSAPALSTLFHASNLDWRPISHMIISMFQCYSLKSSHPRLLPQSSKVCSFHLCLFCCLVYRFIVTTFLNSIYIYVLIYCIGVFLSDLLRSV